MKNLKELLKEEGRSITWLKGKLEEKGVTKTMATLSHWANNKKSPNNLKIIIYISEILEYEFNDIEKLFKKQYIKN